MSTRALRTSEASKPGAGGASPDGRSRPGASEPPAGLRAARYLDLALLALALPIFVLAGFPLLGWAAGALAWLAQRGIRTLIDRQAAAADDPRTVVGLTTASMIGRGWLVALTIFGAGLIENDAGLAAALLTIALFTVFLSGQMILRPFDAPAPPSAGKSAGSPSRAGGAGAPSAGKRSR